MVTKQEIKRDTLEIFLPSFFFLLSSWFLSVFLSFLLSVCKPLWIFILYKELSNMWCFHRVCYSARSRHSQSSYKTSLSARSSNGGGSNFTVSTYSSESTPATANLYLPRPRVHPFLHPCDQYKRSWDMLAETQRQRSLQYEVVTTPINKKDRKRNN